MRNGSSASSDTGRTRRRKAAVRTQPHSTGFGGTFDRAGTIRRAVAISKTSGIGAQILVADSGGTARDISNDISDFNFGTPRAAQDITGVDKSAHERLLLLADFTVSYKGTFNPAANLSHAVFSTIPSTSVTRSNSIAPTSSHASPLLACNVLFSDYTITRAAGGELTFDVKGDLADGVAPVWA